MCGDITVISSNPHSAEGAQCHMFGSEAIAIVCMLTEYKRNVKRGYAPILSRVISLDRSRHRN